MSPATETDREMAQIKRAFWPVVVAILVVFTGLFVGISKLNGSTHRPEGTAEHWLEAVGDTTRKGLHDEAVKRADKIGPVAIAEGAKTTTGPLIPADTEKKSAFPDLEVGKAAISGDSARVPYRLHQRAKVGKNPLVEGEVVLKRDSAAQGAHWKVVGLTTTKGAAKVPSEGGPPPSRAPAGLWLVGLAVGALVTLGASALVRWAGAGRAAAPAT
jgi:hypothetical protein